MFFIFIIGIIGGICLLLALPSLRIECSVKRLALAFLTSGFGIIAPLLVFFFSAFLTPEWKGGCLHGWLDCFHLGKLALAPVVLWAAISFYVVEILRPNLPPARHFVMGLFLGSVVAGTCFLYGLTMLPGQSTGMMVCLIVPFYTAVWYGIRLVQAHHRTRPDFVWYLFCLLGSSPFWFAGLEWSRRIFATLPDAPPDCFIVTAATRGHERLVGPFTETIHRNQQRTANLQLLTFWEFERHWREGSSQSHRWFRSVYNRFGPVIARQINSPMKADAAYLALKPIEWIARLTNRICLRQTRRTA